MKFVIRDDDTCAFTSPDEINACYRDIWQDVPVSLSVTPYRIPGNDRNAPQSLKGNMDVLPLHGNTELVEFLRREIRAGHVDITMHGYHHWRCEGLPEFVACDDLQRKAAEGRSYLNEVLGVEILTFVPPNNSISRIGIDAITAAGMNLATIVRLWSPLDRKVTLRCLAFTPGVLWHRLNGGHKYPHILDMGDHKEVVYYTAGPAADSRRLADELRYCHEQDGVFVLATHYHAFDSMMQDGVSVRAAVEALVDKACGLGGVDFVGFNSIWD